MRRVDDTPVDPEIAAALDAIDGTLAGEPVDPTRAELAELALLLAAERPRIDPAFATVLDEGVARRFAAARPSVRATPAARRRWLWTPAAGLATAAVVAVAIVLGTGGGTQAGHVPAAPTATSTAASSSASSAASSQAAKKLPANIGSGVARRLGSAAGASTGIVLGPNGAPAPVLAPPANGRKIIQAAQLALSTAPSRIETVAQEVFDVVGQQRGIVNNSTVTASGGPGAYAQFQLSLPSSALAQAMAALSSLHYAHVASRTDTTQDINNQYQADVRRLADARALRTSLLKQLAAATTQTQIQSLTAQIHDAEASISSDEASLRSLNNQVDYSQVNLTINGGAQPVPVQSGPGGFTLGRAAHDAGRVLTVAAGVALIAAAGLLPVALLGALGWSVAAALRRRRREQALDLV
jgi:Domain of unknown function (DUF4349)